MTRIALLLISLHVSLLGCTPSPPSTALYDAPWPSDEDLADGGVSVARFPEGTSAPLRRAVGAALRGAEGFGRTAGVFFPFDVPLDPSSLPAIDDDPAAGSVLLVRLDGGERARVDVRFLPDGGPFGGTNLLAVLPFPGLPLAPRARYACVVTTQVRDASGLPLPAVVLDAADRRAVVDAGLAPDAVAAVTVFRTGDPTRGLREAVGQASLRLATPPVWVETHARFCVYAATLEVPVFQQGNPPYLQEGGAWAYTSAGTLVRQRTARSRLVLTVPRDDPGGARPAAVFVRAGGGGDRPLVDRGPRDVEGRALPGTGVADALAEAGVLGASFDGPLGGLRNTAGWDEQVILFNLLNPDALSDNIRQSALEHALFAELVEQLDFDTSDCAGAPPRTRVRPGPTLIAHSNGATIAPLAAAVQPRYRAVVLSGAGMSWIRQVVHKQSPVALRPVVSLLLGYGPHRETFEHDPMLSLLAWAGEPADPLVYGERLRDRDRLVFQGVRDSYIPPPIANPTALSLGLTLEGPALDAAAERPVTRDLALAPPPTDPHVHALVQLPEDGIEDGHEVFFQQPAARARLVRFLREVTARPQER